MVHHLGPIRTSLATTTGPRSTRSHRLLDPWMGTIRLEGSSTTPGKSTSHVPPTLNPTTQGSSRSYHPLGLDHSSFGRPGRPFPKTRTSTGKIAHKKPQAQLLQVSVRANRSPRHGLPDFKRLGPNASRPGTGTTRNRNAHFNANAQILFRIGKLL